jgi:ATP-dependent protease ClpP protease subunit
MTINILEDITGSLAAKILDQVEANTDPEISVNIMSRGGDVTAGTAIIEALRMSPAKVTTKVYGLAASMAAAVSQVGSVRLISDSALFQPHNAAALPMGRPTKESLKATAEALEVVDTILLRSFHKSNLTEAALKDLLIEDKPLNAAQATKMGFFDGRLEPIQAAAKLNTLIMSKETSIKERLIALKEHFSPKAEEILEEEIIDPAAPADPSTETPAEEVVEEVTETVSRSEFEKLVALVEELIKGMSPIPNPSVEEVVAAKLEQYMTAIKSDGEIPVATAVGAPEEEQKEEAKSYLEARQKEIQSKFKEN